jgi:hypothetical protein
MKQDMNQPKSPECKLSHHLPFLGLLKKAVEEGPMHAEQMRVKMYIIPT